MGDQVSGLQTFVALLRWRAQERPDQRVYTFLNDGELDESHLTYIELDTQARTIAAHLQTYVAPGDRILLLYPPGLDFIAAFFGCLYAGIIAVPAYPPHVKRPNKRLAAIAHNAHAQLILTTEESRQQWQQSLAADSILRHIPIFCTDTIAQSAAAAWRPPVLGADDLAFLQYTSGSTGEPKGVMLSHGNLLHNERMIATTWRNHETDRIVSWLPLFHDMGLIGNLLQPLYVGAWALLMPPVAFLENPIRWLRAIATAHATISGGPNFAYELCLQKITPAQCTDLDLRSWRIAFTGAEPVRPDTMARFTAAFAPYGFQETAFYPGYGLAEATLFVTGNEPQRPPTTIAVERDALAQGQVRISTTEDAQRLASCGQSWCGQQIRIVHPERLTPCAEREIGEIWLSGPSVAQGYWQQPALTAATFHARLADRESGPFLRTGDLGFLQQGELFVTGRLKDLIIIRGRNHYPQDIEWSVAQAHPALQAGNGAAFVVEGTANDSATTEQLIVVQEVKRAEWRALQNQTTVDEISTAIRRQVAVDHGLQVQSIVLLKPATIPMTSSGKIQRHACRTAFLEQTLSGVIVDTPAIAASRPNGSAGYDAPQTPTEAQVAILWAELLGVRSVGRHDHFFALGGNSVMVAQAVAAVRATFGVELALEALFTEPTVAAVAEFIDTQRWASKGLEEQAEGVFEL